MHARTDRPNDYQDLELASQADEAKEETRNARATQTSPPPPRNSSTCFVLESLGFYPELSKKKKLLLLLCALLAVYETFEPVERGSNDLLGLFTEGNELTHGISRGIASLISLVILIATLRGMGKGLKNLEQYSDRVDHHSTQLLDLKNQLNIQRQETAELHRRLTNTIENTNKTQTPRSRPVILLGNPEPASPANETPKEQENGNRFKQG